MAFALFKQFELRSDNPNLLGLTVRLDDQVYSLCYEKDQLREVYFMSVFKNYFMSCRSDFKTISHYYTLPVQNPIRTNHIIKRYENGICNRVYLCKGRETVSTTDGSKRVYTLYYETPSIEVNKVYADLVIFLTRFKQLGLDQLFSPEEPLDLYS